MNRDQEARKPVHLIRWIIMGAFILIILKIAGIGFRHRDQIFGGSETFSAATYDSESMEMGPKSKVIVTLNNNTYHLRGCEAISGITEKTNYNTVIRKAVTPCTICISDGF